MTTKSNERMNVMRKFGLFLILTTVALAQSAVSADREHQDHQNAAQAVSSASHTANHPPAVHLQPHSSAAPCHAVLPAANHDAAHSDHDHVALADMHSHLLRQFGNAHPEPNTFGTADGWSHDWELRWIDYHSAGGTVRVYHATDKHDPAKRFTMVADPSHPHDHTWHPVH